MELDIDRILKTFVTRGHHGEGKHVRARKQRTAYGSTGPRDSAKRAEWLKTDEGKAYAERQAAKKPVTPRVKPVESEQLTGGASFTGKISVKEWDDPAYSAEDRAVAKTRRELMVKTFGAETFGGAKGASDFSAKDLARLAGVPDGATVTGTSIVAQSRLSSGSIDPNGVSYDVHVTYRHPNLSFSAERIMSVTSEKKVTMEDVFKETKQDPLRSEYEAAKSRFDAEVEREYTALRRLSKSDLIRMLPDAEKAGARLEDVGPLRRRMAERNVSEDVPNPSREARFQEVLDGPRPEYTLPVVQARLLASTPVTVTKIAENKYGSRSDQSPPGFHMECLNEQVTQLSKAGFTRLTTTTDGDGRTTASIERQRAELTALGVPIPPTFTSAKMSYYAQMKAGYDAPITRRGVERLGLDPESDTDRVVTTQYATATRIGNAIRGTRFEGADTVHDILKIPGGVDWWRANGTALPVTFDLRPNSSSRSVLTSYVQERRAAIRRGDATDVASSATARPSA